MWMFHWNIQAIGRPSYTLFRVRSVLEVLFLESFIGTPCKLYFRYVRRTDGQSDHVRLSVSVRGIPLRWPAIAAVRGTIADMALPPKQALTKEGAVAALGPTPASP